MTIPLTLIGATLFASRRKDRGLETDAALFKAAELALTLDPDIADREAVLEAAAVQIADNARQVAAAGINNSDLIRRLCKSLAYHTWETEAASKMIVGGPDAEIMAPIHEARALIKEAGFEFDELLPPEEQWEPRPVEDMSPRVM